MWLMSLPPVLPPSQHSMGCRSVQAPVQAFALLKVIATRQDP